MRFINSRQGRRGRREGRETTDGNWFQTGSEIGRERLNWNFSRPVWIKRGILRSCGKYWWRKGLDPRSQNKTARWIYDLPLGRGC